MYITEPTHIIVDSVPPASRAAIYIAVGSLAVSVASAAVTFRFNVRGWRSAWFHKVAVDPMLPAIFSFFDDQEEKLVNAAIIIKNRGTRKSTPRPVTIALNAFQEMHTNLYEQVSGRLQIFDLKAGTKILQLMEDHQDAIGGALFRGPDQVSEALLNAKNELMDTLRNADH
jgi:hypothetical protein